MTIEEKMIKLSEILAINADIVSNGNPRSEKVDAIWYSLIIISNCIKALFEEEGK